MAVLLFISYNRLYLIHEGVPEMSDAVNPRRAYSSPRRREQARATRSAVLAHARELFIDGGYAITTVPAIAAAAGVSVETIYKSVGNKPAIVKAVFDVAIVGDDEPIPLRMRDTIVAIEAEPDPRRKLAMYGEHVGAIGGRIGPILLVVRAAAETDPGAADVWTALQQERLSGMTMFAAHLAAGGHLRPGLGADEARDVLWTHNSVEMWDLLVRQRGWTDDRFGAWIGQQLAAA